MQPWTLKYVLLHAKCSFFCLSFPSGPLLIMLDSLLQLMMTFYKAWCDYYADNVVFALNKYNMMNV